MWKYITKRVLLMLPIILGVTLVVFTIMYFTPGSPGELLAGANPDQAVIDQINHELGFDQPFHVRYFNFLKGIVTKFDFGTSYTSQRPVLDEIMSRFPRTLTLAFFSMISTAVVGISIGILSAVKQYSLLDYASTVVSMFFSSMPSFWIGMMLLLWIAMNFSWFPINGVASWKGYLLPCAALTFCNAAPLMRLTRSAMLETIRSDYIRTARAKGALEKRVIWKHAFKNALLPVVTNIGNNFRALLGGSVITETVFVIPGLGSYVITAIRSKDVPVVMGCTLFMSATFLVVILLTDILYAYIDPRVKAKYMR
ncbi:MAG: ABC transporter permease [Oscillibacter sp.]|jgi:peptide/nickel transport system permease protein|uniref:ABC transporter permease n=1 Tax=uncultured Oscillibacter sp. TaxID=876091 RepID=UPI0021709318|nr:ABC transporter permease [uncultured Oscillibacter sp.]MCI9643133.1 ABC transporter permease [Oscillibacter sp.]